MTRVLWLAAFLLIVLLAGGARCHRLRDVFVGGRIYFLDPDCYSRMTRARMVSEGTALTIRHHDFENWPQGVTPHTTAPLDWLIASLAKAPLVSRDSILYDQRLDLAGALVGPLLGMFACGAIMLLLKRSGWALVAGGLAAVSPILAHGTSLGRPDHQALLIPLLAAALALELKFLKVITPATAVASGILWGISLWVSLYEPLVLLVLAAVALVLAKPDALFTRGRWWQGGSTLIVFVCSISIDGWRLGVPSPELREAFQRWQLTIGELRSPNLGLLLGWLGGACVLAPLALGCQWRRSAEARWLLAILIATVGLTCWQLRWGYFLALVYTLSLPIQVDALARRRWIAGTALVVGLWPMAHHWDAVLFDDSPAARRAHAIQRLENQALREISDIQAARHAGPFIAPWWLSPAVAYWTRQPGVSGSSHQSLPGILDSARVYLAPDEEAARPILEARKVKWILADAPDRVIQTSAALLNVPPPAKCFAHSLIRPIQGFASGESAPPANQFFQVWQAGQSPPILRE